MTRKKCHSVFERVVGRGWSPSRLLLRLLLENIVHSHIQSKAEKQYDELHWTLCSENYYVVLRASIRA
jgi:hypothetical protein